MIKEEAIKILDEVIPPPEHHTVDLDHLRIAQAWLCIKETLTATKPIIQCKDCKHHEDEELGMVYCPNIVGGWVSNNFYCGYAERRESEEC